MQVFESDIAAIQSDAQPQWQPIETAPRDGTYIILARYIDGRFIWASNAKWSVEFNRFWDGAEPSGFHCPTHWIQLPAAPVI